MGNLLPTSSVLRRALLPTCLWGQSPNSRSSQSCCPSSAIRIAANIAITSGNNQSAPAGTLLPQGLTVLVTDQYGNPVPGVDVDYDDGGAGGTYAYANPGTTSNSGTATQFYTLPPSPGTIIITAIATGVAASAVFTETAQ